MPIAGDQPYPISVVDTFLPQEMPDLVGELEELGYARYWSTEHYGPGQGASPTIATALAAGCSRTIRVGTAGVLLKLYRPFRVAQDFRYLELLFPGRIDLGVAAALPRGKSFELLRLAADEITRASFDDKVEELTRLIRPANEEAGLRVETAPELWVCGSGPGSARLAGRLGVSFAYHEFFARLGGVRADGPRILEEYRAAFRPSGALQSSRSAIACYGLCARSTDQARRQWDAVSPPGPPSFLGTGAQCRRQLIEQMQRHGADELVVQSCAPHGARKTSYRLLARAFELERP